MQNLINKNGPIPDYNPSLGPCWIWLGCLNHDGYGRRKIDGRYQYVHRYMLEQRIGEMPKYMDTDHLCRVRNCVNPDHLESVTRKENVRRGILGDVVRKRQLAITHCPQGHEYTPENTYNPPNTKDRRCKICAYNSSKLRQKENSEKRTAKLKLERGKFFGLKRSRASKYPHVYFDKSRNKWRVEINKRIYGRFLTEEEANKKVQQVLAEIKLAQ